MEQRFLGQSGLAVSRLGLGTMTWGRDTDQHEAQEQLVDFVEAGGTLIDTAYGYADGDSELLLGSLLQKTVSRNDVVLATKAGIYRKNREQRTNASRGHLLKALDESLKRLQVDHVDLWQVHIWDDSTPIEETLSALDYAVHSGRASYVGISNYSAWQTAQAATLQKSIPNRAPLISTQMEYSLLNRDVELEVIPAAEALGLGLLCWSPLGRGVLTGKYRTGIPVDSRGASRAFAGFVARYEDDRSKRIVEAVARAAEGLDMTPLEVALTWVRDRPGVSSAIVGARTAEQLRASLATEKKQLPSEISKALNDVSN
jgi:aryl-alcohol dehydrogenase-like predicted oxidoreductase